MQLTLCGCHVTEQHPQEVFILPQGKSHFWQLQYLEMLFRKYQWFTKSNPKAYCKRNLHALNQIWVSLFQKYAKTKDHHNQIPSLYHLTLTAILTEYLLQTILAEWKKLGCLYVLNVGLANWVYSDFSSLWGQYLVIIRLQQIDHKNTRKNFFTVRLTEHWLEWAVPRLWCLLFQRYWDLPAHQLCNLL